jgi:hypothetical protein
MNLDNPVLAYTFAILLAKGLTLSPTEMSRIDMMQRHIRWALTDGLSGIVEEAVKEVTALLEKKRKFHGTAVKGELEDLEIIAPGLKEKLVQSALTQARKTHFVDEQTVHAEAVEHFGKEKLVAMLRTCERQQ